MNAEIKKMTVDEFLALPDYEKNALVAEKVMGWQVVTEDDEQPDQVPYLVGPDHKVFYPNVAKLFPETQDPLFLANWIGDIAAAWEVVERMRARKYTSEHNCTPKGYRFCFLDNGRTVGRHNGETISISICIAALKAVGVIE